MTPLVILIGFLGAGKTMLLRACLPDLVARGLAPAVILNDYVNAGVDATTLAGLVDDLTPIDGTCVCCDSRDALLGALMSARRGPRALVLVEANGTADAGDLIEVLAADRALGEYSLPVQVSVVDAGRWQRRHWYDALEAEQVRTAAFVVITRDEEVTPARRDEVRAALRRLAPAARIVDAKGLCHALGEMAGESADQVARRFGADGGRSGHHHLGRHHASAVEIPLAGTLDRATLDAWLRSLPPEVVRTKGVAHLAGEGWVYFSRLDDDESISIRRIPVVDLEPVAILIGAGLPRGLGAGVERHRPDRLPRRPPVIVQRRAPRSSYFPRKDSI